MTTDTCSSPRAVAKALGMSATSIILLCQRGVLRAWKSTEPGIKGGRWHILDSSVADYIQDRLIETERRLAI